MISIKIYNQETRKYVLKSLTTDSIQVGHCVIPVQNENINNLHTDDFSFIF